MNDIYERINNVLLKTNFKNNKESKEKLRKNLKKGSQVIINIAEQFDQSEQKVHKEMNDLYAKYFSDLWNRIDYLLKFIKDVWNFYLYWYIWKLKRMRSDQFREIKNS